MSQKNSKTNDLAGKVLEVKDWATPYTGVPEALSGRARLHFARYTRGYYRLEGIDGYEFYHLQQSLGVMCLQIREGRKWNTWMVDDPLHWLGMEAFVKRLRGGKVLCAGLGLGLMVFHLVKQPYVTGIDIVEREPDVVHLIEPHLPKDPRITIYAGLDFYEFIQRPPVQYDCVLWDLAVGERKDTWLDFILAGRIKYHLPHTQLMRFGAISDLRGETK